jgi:SAM-dependent methyltransferase
MTSTPAGPHSQRGAQHAWLSPALQEKDLAALETAVVPKYLSFFAGLATGMLLPCTPATVVVLGSRAGFETDLVAERLPDASLKGLETSEAGVRAASQRVSSLAVASTYEVVRGLPTQLPHDTFTHALAIHPITHRSGRQQLLAEMCRVLVPGGQAVVALPLRGSFPEIGDMIREFALRTDLAKVGEAVDIATTNRPTPETLTEELEAAGLAEAEVDVELLALPFDSGKDFVTHPVFELVVAHEMRTSLDVAPAVVNDALAYVETAVQKYWSDGPFELTVNIGCASGRKAG